jgi:cysteinyl-tRNA synthetase
VPLLLPDAIPPRLTWYNCGPTVYDSAHLGHARTYVTLDILRRIATNHFGIQILAAMGLTDVDDKIINRAAERVWMLFVLPPLGHL